jgi:hypothetical protein
MQNITETTNAMLNTITIPVSDYNSLKEQVDSLNREIGSKDQLIENLKSNEKVISKTIRITPYGPNETTIENIGLGELKDTLRQEIKNDFIKRIEDANNEAIELNYKILDLKAEGDQKDLILTEIRTNHDREINNLNKKERLRLNDLKEDYQEQLQKKNKFIEELKDEIEKIKEDKTDAQVEEQRNKEIIDLKAKIAQLEEELASLRSMNFFKRLTYSRKVTDAEKAVAREKARLDKVTQETGTTYVKENGKIRKNETSNYQDYSLFVNNYFRWLL